ncbi:hypothetical protein AB0368_18720 [Actinoplanes sp. NPDC051475]|uniref:SCO4225 family membrane protein n=1 Tax=Actinoplanes sp. NPDC051475 TaxID=3157225 RepID=UPI00344F8F28
MTKFFFGNWVTRCYLLAVAAAAVFLLGAHLVTGDEGPSFAGIYLIGLTAPVSVIFAPIALLGGGWLASAMLWLSVVAGMLLNTLLINTIVGEAGRFRSRRA